MNLMDTQEVRKIILQANFSRRVLVSSGCPQDGLKCPEGCLAQHNSVQAISKLEVIALIALMLLENKANPDAKDHLASTPLHRAASKGNLKMMQILLNHKASVNLQDSEGNTPLHLACDEERVEEAKLLVARGASIYIENKEEKTPLKVAKGGLASILRRLVEG